MRYSFARLLQEQQSTTLQQIGNAANAFPTAGDPRSVTRRSSSSSTSSSNIVRLLFD